MRKYKSLLHYTINQVFIIDFVVMCLGISELLRDWVWGIVFAQPVLQDPIAVLDGGLDTLLGC